MKLVALVRVSTKSQALEGYGLDVQEDRIRAWAKRNHHRIVAVVREEGVSGAAPDRAGVAEALRYLAEDRADGIVVASLDRLSRVMIAQEQLLAEVQTLGGELHSTIATEDANLTDDPDDPLRKLVRQIVGSIHEYERSMVRIRLQAGYDRKAAAGGYMGGRPPYGWAAIGKALRPVEAEQVQRRRIKEWHRQGWSTQKIADKLNDEGIPTKAGAKWTRVPVNRVIRDDRRAMTAPRRTTETIHTETEMESVIN